MGVLARTADLVRSLGRRGDAMPPSSPGMSAQYFRTPTTGSGAALFAWRPALRDARDDVRSAYLEAAARAIDTLHNSGWIAGAVEQSIVSTIGVGLRLSAMPDRKALGWSDEQAEDWIDTVERRWIMWSESPVECDAAGTHTIGQLTAQVLRSHFAYGEALVLLPAIDRPISLTRTKVQIVPPHRLVQDSDDLSRLYQGVRIDDFGLPLAYRIKRDRLINDTVDIAARDGAGRPQVIHVFEGAAGQVRGITPLAPVLRVVRQFDQLADATLTAALIQAIFAATIESEAPTEQMLQALQDQDEQGTSGDIFDFFGAKEAWYRSTKIDLGVVGRIAHLFPGEALKFNRSEHPNDTYEAFAKFLLREIARCLGMTFETLTGDYTGATYSSVRMATAEIWPIILARRANVCGRFLQHVYEAWLEEEIEAGRIEFPGGLMGFLANRPAAVAADWRGPAKPQADDLKAAKAHQTYKELGVVSDEMICADLGVDWEDVYEQRAREMAKRKKLGLPEGNTLAPDPVGDKLVTEDA
ncbi:phage portal protein [Chelatococcus sp. XZ-Ab1]|uniref:phage portal protein n=1 Tax=Chelatococcus sp. XZ-Ab1 TaxID=3034027 RepID=UPI0023E43ACB|nr:phage portal protein [Chelatococcus sp. XZ-Ab1]